MGSLTDGSSYQFKVRAKNATGDGLVSEASDAATPANRTLAGSSVEATTATLTIAGHVAAWYYKANVAPGQFLQGAGGRRDVGEGSDGAFVEHELPLRGVQRQFLHLREPAGDGADVSDQAGEGPRRRRWRPMWGAAS